MEYNNFLETVKETVQNSMGEDYIITLTHVRKNNGICLDGILIARKGRKISPAFYLNDQYQAVRRGKSIRAVAEEIRAVYYEKEMPDRLDLGFFDSYQAMKRRVLFKIVHYDKNRELLKEIPHIRFLDLAVVFFCDISGEQIENGTILIYHSHLERWQITPEELYRDAVGNTPRDYPAAIQSMEEVMEELFDDRAEGAEEDFIWKKAYRPQEYNVGAGGYQYRAGRRKMYVLSNGPKLFGASAAIYPDVLKQFADRMAANLYVLPSSVHEMILLPDDGSHDRAALRRMVREINATQVDPEEVLADSVYYFNREKEKLDIL